MNFKQLISKAALTAAMVAVPAMAQSWSHVIDTDTSRDYGANGMSSIIYYGLTHKFVDGNSFTIESRNDLEWRASRKNDTKMKHVYLRFVYSMPNLYNLGENTNFGMNFRYRAPTSTTEQLQGSLGQLLLKPYIKTKLGPVDVKLTESFGPYLQRQRATRNQKIGPTSVATANPLFTSYQELAIGLPLVLQDLAFNANFTQQNTYYGEANNADGYWANFFEQDYEIRYAIASLDQLEVAIATTHGTYFGKTSAGTSTSGPTSELWFNETSTYALRITKEF